MSFIFAAILAAAGAPNNTAADTVSVTLVGRTWNWVETIDADSSVYRPDSTSAGHSFVFYAGGRFEESYPRGCCDYAGWWQLDEMMLRLRYEGDRSDTVTYRIITLTANELALGVRGRHGTVVEWFVAHTPE